MSIEIKRKLYQAMDPDGVLTDSELKAFYVDLDGARGESNRSVRDELYHKVCNTADGTFTYSCVAGHRGCGKSTELRKLEIQFKNNSQYHPVLIEMDHLIDVGDVDFVDVALAIISSLGKALEEQNLAITSTLVQKVFTELISTLKSSIDIIQAKWSVGALELMAEIKASDVNRGLVRRALNQRTVSLIEAVNDVIQQANVQLQQCSGQQLVILVDGLDKMIMRTIENTEMSMAAHLFDKNADQLKSFQCHMVYMLPIEILHSPEGPNIELAFGNISFVPMVKVSEFGLRGPGAKVSAGVDVLTDLIAKRCKVTELELIGEVFENEEILEEMIVCSGGQPRVIQSIIRSAMNDGGLPLTADSLKREYNKIRRSYDRILTRDHIDVILEIQNRKGAKPRNPEMQTPLMELLANRGVLKYHNGVEWYAPNPLLPSDAWPDEQ